MLLSRIYSDPNLIRHGAIDNEFAGVFGGGGFEEENGGAVFGDGVVFDALGDDEHVALF